jgi:hypothetical protein
MSDAVLVRDRAEWAAWRRRTGDDGDGAAVYTIDAQFFLELVREGAQPHILSEFVTAEEAQDLYQRAYDDITRVVDELAQMEGGPFINLGRFFKVHYWEYLSEAYTLDLVMQRLLNGAGKVRFAWFDHPVSMLQRHTEMVQADRIVQQILDSLSAQHPDHVQRLTRENGLDSAGRQGVLESFGPTMQQLKGRVGSALRRGMAVFGGSSARPAQQRAIAFGSGYDALIVIPDALRLAAAGGPPALWMTEGVDKRTLRSGLRYRDEYDAVERFSISRYLSAHPSPALTNAETAQAGRSFDCLMDGLNELDVVRRHRLTEGLDGLRGKFVAALRRAKEIDSVLARFAGSTIFLTDYNGLDERAIEQLAPRHGITTVARPHGWMANIEGFEFVADHYLVSGALWRGVVEEFYGSHVPVSLSPDPSLTHVAAEWIVRNAEQQQEIVRQGRTLTGIEAPHVLLLMTTASRRGRILNEFDYPVLRDTWDTIFSFLERHDDVHLLIKSHKNNYDAWVSGRAEERGVGRLTVVHGRLEDALVLADLVVDFGKPGTATLSALLFERPLLLYRGLYKYVRHLGDHTHAAAGAALVQSPQKMIDEWERWLREGATYTTRLRGANRALLRLLAAPSPQDDAGPWVARPAHALSPGDLR